MFWVICQVMFLVFNCSNDSSKRILSILLRFLEECMTNKILWVKCRHWLSLPMSLRVIRVMAGFIRVMKGLDYRLEDRTVIVIIQQVCMKIMTVRISSRANIGMIDNLLVSSVMIFNVIV